MASNNESRVKKTLLNARVNLFFYFLTLLLSFFSRKIFLDCLGADFVGLTGTLQNLLGFLNLAELGIGTAIGYTLYKPLFDKDHDKINDIISVMGYLYRWIGFVILGIAIVISLFLPLIFPYSDTGFRLPLVYFAFYSFLASSLIGYFINYRQNLLGADQRNYVVTGYFQTATIVKTIVQMSLVYFTSSYYLWIAIELVFGIIYSFILNWKINQTYPWLKAEVKQGRRLFKQYPEVIRYTKQLFVHKVASFVQFQTTPMMIYAFVNLNIVALYGNYIIIVDKLSTLFSKIIGSTGASVGNLIAEGDINKAIVVYWELFTIQIFIATFCAFELYILINPFINLWIGEKYVLSTLVLVLILIRYFISQTRIATDQFLFGFGLFYDTWAPLAESCIYLVIGIIGGWLWGLPGILLGGLSSLIAIVCVWKPIFLFSKGFKLPLRRYWINLFKLYGITLVSMGITYFVSSQYVDINPSTSVSNWILYACISSCCIIFIYGTLMYIFTPSMRRLVNRGIVLFKRQRGK